jgi:NTP pyrophosphatase (non-canonical NTP hydrolase)
MDIKEIQEEIYEIAKDKGFHEGEPDIPEILCLVHSEVSEALEEYRKGSPIMDIFYTRNGEIIPHVQVTPEDKPEGFPVELADVIMRVLDLAEKFGIDMEKAIETKLAYNKTREHKHGKLC